MIKENQKIIQNRWWQHFLNKLAHFICEISTAEKKKMAKFFLAENHKIKQNKE